MRTFTPYPQKCGQPMPAIMQTFARMPPPAADPTRMPTADIHSPLRRGPHLLSPMADYNASVCAARIFCWLESNNLLEIVNASLEVIQCIGTSVRMPFNKKMYSLPAQPPHSGQGRLGDPRTTCAWGNFANPGHSAGVGVPKVLN